MEEKKWIGPGGMTYNPESGVLKFNLFDRLDAAKICELHRFSVFAGTKKGKKHKALGVIKWHDKVPCEVDVIAVKMTEGWVFFYNSEENFQRLRESLSKSEISGEKFDNIFSGVNAVKSAGNGKGEFLAYAGLLQSYKIRRSKQVVVGERWVDHDDMIPTLESVYETKYYDEDFTMPGKWVNAKIVKCACSEYISFGELYSFLEKVQAAEAEKKRVKEEAHRKQKEAERLERERQEKERREREEAERLALWNKRKREKVEQLRLERQKKSETQLQEERKKRTAGKIGEKEVEYVIKWLMAEGYQSVPKKRCVKYDDEAIMLWNPDFIDEPQEFDHIVLGRRGLFLIETKNLRGTLVVNRSGNWIRVKDGVEEGVLSPVQQIRRHEKLLRSFLPKNIPIIPIICIAHPEVIIKGAENCAVPLVKSDMLGDYIESQKGERLSEPDLQKCLTLIERYRLE